MAYVNGDFLANLNKVANMVREAGKKGARWIVLPEYFASGLAWDAQLVDASLPIDGLPTKLLKSLAKETGASVAGTFLAQPGDDTYNTLVLAHSSGQVYFHDKDDPTGPIEAAHWIAGTDDGVMKTRDGPVGAAICWEQIRFRTAQRLLKARVGLVLSPAAFGSLPGDNTHANLLENAPVDFAKLVGAPLILANPVGRIDSDRGPWAPDRPGKIEIDMLGNSRIVDGHGNVVARQVQGEGIVYGEIEIGAVEPSMPKRDETWIPDMPAYWLDRHETLRRLGAQAYQDKVKPERNRLRNQIQREFESRK